jgi:DNA-binding beta-propeller fold protein YncE
MRSVLFALLAVCACGNDLPPPGMCGVATNGEMPTVEHVQLAGRSAGYDDLRYSPQLGKVLAVPGGTAKLYMIDPDSMALTMAGVPGGAESVDANATTIYVLDRSNDAILAIDATTLMTTQTQGTTGNPDYVRYSPTSNEVWVTLPGRNRIEILDAPTLAPVANVDVPGAPEGLTFDSTGLAYTQAGGRMIQINVEQRMVTGEWDTGCGASHGFPQVDEGYGLAIAGCSSNGGIGVTTTTGEMRAGFEAGGDSAILAHDGTKHHLFVRGDPGATLDILAVCSDGGTSVLGSVELSMNGHGATVDDRGHAWVADAIGGAVFRITDPFPATN